MDLETLNPDIVEEILARHGAQAISLSDAGNDPVLEPERGETPLWRDTCVSALFPADADIDAVRQDLLAAFELEGLPRHDVAALGERDWEREWLKDFAPMQFGDRLWICPGDGNADTESAVVVRLDPGLAFGTGTHATTALCLEWLDSLAIEGASVLDYGCGSGILAIAALKLGADEAAAIDVDPQAVTATRNNARRNQVDDALIVLSADEQIDREFDIVVANILARPIIELAASIAGRVGHGCLLALSGILSDQVSDVRVAYSPWIDFDEPLFREQGGQSWARLTGRRIEG